MIWELHSNVTEKQWNNGDQSLSWNQRDCFDPTLSIENYLFSIGTYFNIFLMTNSQCYPPLRSKSQYIMGDGLIVWMRWMTSFLGVPWNSWQDEDRKEKLSIDWCDSGVTLVAINLFNTSEIFNWLTINFYDQFNYKSHFPFNNIVLP